MERKGIDCGSLLAQMRSESKKEAEKFFKEAYDEFNSNSELQSREMFSGVLKDSDFDNGCREFIRSFSASSGWEQRFVQTKTETKSNTMTTVTKTVDDRRLQAQQLSTSFPRFASFGGFPRLQFMSQWPEEPNQTYTKSEKIHMTRSVFEYCSSSSSNWMNYQRSYHESFDVSESESEEETVGERRRAISCAPSESETSSLAPLELEGPPQLLAIEAPPDVNKEKAYRLANELLTTERSYVAVLHLIDQVFHFRIDQENRAHNMFPQDMVPQMFSNIKSIYKFHHDFLLPQLEERMKNWDKEPRIGDIMKNFAPFLKLYTEYVKNFDNAMNIINALYTKNRKFAALMDEIHRLPECGNLTLTHHMLSPIQRVPRYQLLLCDYLKKLNDYSIDHEDTKRALELVSTAANHSNEAMKKIDKFKQLLELEESISGICDLVSPTRELLKQGKVMKISARSGDHQERYLFILSDLVLLCSSRLISNRVISGPAYRLRAKLRVDTLQVLEGDNLETANTFYIRDTNKNFELYTQTAEEKGSWLNVLLLAMQELHSRKSSLKICGGGLSRAEGSELGRKAPTLIKADTVTKCMECSCHFGVMKRKHHCRCCGLVVCGKCSCKKIPLVFEDNKSCRVCNHCYSVLSQCPSSPEEPLISPDNDNFGAYTRGKGVLDVAADAPSVISGYLQLKARGKSWQRRWFALHSDFVLYSFRSHVDHSAVTATPVPGYTIAKALDYKGESVGDKEKIFKMYHAKKMYYFQAVSKEEADRWIEVLQKAAKAEVPTPTVSDHERW